MQYAQNAAPIVVGWFSHDVHLPWVPTCYKNGSCTRTIPIEPVGGLSMRDTTVIDSHLRPFISCGSPRFPNGSQYVDHMPEVVQNITFMGRVESTASPVNTSIVCGADLGPVVANQYGGGYAIRGVVLDVDCQVSLAAAPQPHYW